MDNTDELNEIMARMGWSKAHVAELLPVKGKPRSVHTVYSWMRPKQKNVIPDAELKLLRIIAAIEEGKSLTALRRLAK